MGAVARYAYKHPYPASRYTDPNPVELIRAGAMMVTDAPAETTTLIGRTAELEQLGSALERSRLVTLTGAIGVGKSRLALRVAWSYTGDVVFRSADKLGDLREMAVGTLLIIDGADSDLSVVHDVVEDLLRRLPHVRVLVTSRTRLRLGVEMVVTLHPFAVFDPALVQGTRYDAAISSDAVSLLTQRAADAITGFAPSEANAEGLLGICAAVQGVPLAIECAARALRVLDPHHLRRTIEGDIGVLDEFAPSDVPSFDERFSRTWKSCSEGERVLAGQLAAAADLVDIDVARAANGSAASDGELAALLSGLVDRSVLQPVDGEAATFEMLRATRRSIRARVDGDEVKARSRVDQHLVDLMSRTAAAWAGSGLGEQVTALTRHQVAIFALLERYAADPATAGVALELICGLRAYWHWRTTAPAPRARDWIESALRVRPDEDDLRVRALRVDAYIALFENDELAAADQLAEADALAARIGETDEDGFGSLVHGLLQLAHHELDDAEHYFEQALASTLQSDIRTRLGEVYWYLALLRLLHGDLDGAEKLCERSRAVSLENGDEWGDAYALWMVALMTLRRGESDRALSLVRRAIAAMSSYEDRSGIALCVQLMASIAAHRGELEQAARLMGTVRDAAIPELSISEITPNLAGQVRDELGPRLFDRLFGSSASLSPRQAIEYAIESGSDLIPPPVEQRGPLTARELEVAELIAQGWSNTDIATNLYISHRTVEGHVQRMLAKLKFRSRAQVAAWVVSNRVREGHDA